METCGACWEMCDCITLVQGSFRKYENQRQNWSQSVFFNYQASDLLGFYFVTVKWSGAHEDFWKYLKHKLVSLHPTRHFSLKRARCSCAATLHRGTHTPLALVCNKMQHSAPEGEQRWGTRWWRWQEGRLNSRADGNTHTRLTKYQQHQESFINKSITFVKWPKPARPQTPAALQFSS